MPTELNLCSLSENRALSMKVLRRLARSGSGPLRVTESEGVIKLGIRSWPTYFFETIDFKRVLIADAELKTELAMEKYLRPFLSPSDSNTTKNNTSKNLRMNLLSRISSNRPTYKEKSSTSDPETPASTLSENDYWLPHGISVFDCSSESPILATERAPLETIADVRLVREYKPVSTSSKQKRKGNIKQLIDFTEYKQKYFPKGSSHAKNIYEQYYFLQLRELSYQIKSTVVLELFHDQSTGCSEANSAGAKEAAKSFRQFMSDHEKKNVSVMLIERKATKAATEAEQDGSQNRDL